uniref:RNA helicase n=1 Tax=Globodera rostochiensis TaxID=31243 RepID=A0A914HJ34_GLORO
MLSSNKADFFPQVLDSFSGFEENRKKVPRPKHVPEVKTQDQLFDERCHIAKGPLFEENFGVLHDQDIRIAGGRGQTPRNATSFDDCGFDVTILRNIRRRNYSHPTQVQKAVIPIIQNTDCDLMAHAHTGTGKSAAFLLPLVNEIQQMRNAGSAHHNGDSPYSIVIAPTRELVKQLYEDACTFSTGTSVDVALAYGDIPMGVSINQLRKGCDLVVSTVGRLFHYVREGIIKLDKLRFFVLDEMDKFFAYEDAKIAVREVFKEIKRLGSRHRTLMFSATFDSEVQEIANEFLKECFYFVSVGEMNQAVNTVNQTVLKTNKYEKKQVLLQLLRSKSREVGSELDGVLYETEKTIVFINGRRECDRLGIALAYYGYSVITLNSSRTQEQRERAHEGFVKGTYNILVSTDITARGLNFPNVGHVINYDMPREGQSAQYIHRIGRTGRAGNIGRSTSFYDPFTDFYHAEYLFHVLDRSNQIIPDWLELIVRNNHMIRLDAEQQQRITQENGFGEGDSVVNWDDDMNL